MKVLNKQDLIDLMESPTLSKQAAGRAIDLVIGTIDSVLNEGDAVQLKSFGKFSVRKVAERSYRNPQDQSIVSKPATKKVVFKASGSLLN